MGYFSIVKKSYFYLFFLIVVSGFVYLFFSLVNENGIFSSVEREAADSLRHKEKLFGEVTRNSLISPQKAISLHIDKVEAPSPEVRTIAGTPAEAEIVRKWEESRGRFDEETLKDYAGYDLETLKSLVKSDDIKAMIALAMLYVSEQYSAEYGVKYSMPLLKMAAIYGSSYAMELYAIQYEAEHFVNGTNDRAVLLESLSWSNAAALRGDIYPNNSATLELRRKNIQLNTAEIQSVRKRSEEIYQQLLAERVSIGLGDFDNTVPSEVQKYFAYLENYMVVKP